MRKTAARTDDDAQAEDACRRNVSTRIGGTVRVRAGAVTVTSSSTAVAYVAGTSSLQKDPSKIQCLFVGLGSWLSRAVL